MPIDRKAYKADKKKYKATVKENKQNQKQYKSTVKSEKKRTNKANKAEEKKQRNNPDMRNFAFYDFAVKQPNITRPGVKPQRSNYKGDDNENIGRGGKGPKPMSRTGRAKASLMKVKDGLVSRFQSSTPKIGKNELMKPVLESLKPNIAGGKINPPLRSNIAVGKINPPVKKKVETKLTKGQKRSYDLRDAHS